MPPTVADVAVSMELRHVGAAAGSIIIWNAALVAKYEAPIQDSHNKALCVQIVGEHAYFMTNANRWKHARVSTMRPKLPKRLYTPPKPSKYPVFV